jgi:SSS family solute:Na+ symporter
MSTHFTSLDLAVLVGYFAAVMGVALGLRRRSRSVEGFTAAGRALPGWVVGLSILATYVSSISFLALPGKAFAENWNAFVFSLSIPLATWIAVRWFLPFYRASGDVSAYAHLERRFGPWARLYASSCYLLVQVARMGSVMYLMALPLNVLLGWDVRLIILMTGISVTLYSMVGGIAAVIWNDAIQSVVLMGGALVCAGLMIVSLPGGPSELMTVALAHDKVSLGSFAPSFQTSTFWVVLLYGITINLQNFGIDQNYVQRYVTSRSAADARRSVWLGGLLYLPVSALFFLIGTALFAYYAAFPDQLPQTFQSGARADYVFPWFIVSVLPPGVTGLLIAAIFAAAMSTVSTSINSSATLLLTDFYATHFRPGAAEQERMRVLYAGSLVWGLLGTAVALAMIHAESALDAWWTLAGLLSGGMLGLFLLGVLSRRTTSRTAAIATACGLLVILWMALSPSLTGALAAWRSPFHQFMTVVIGTLTVVLVGILLTALTGRLGHAAIGGPARGTPGSGRYTSRIPERPNGTSS